VFFFLGVLFLKKQNGEKQGKGREKRMVRKTGFAKARKSDYPTGSERKFCSRQEDEKQVSA
jgi:hypothetical protein